jgi:crossover junction endodeoxyribonuclease RuvC
MRILGIDPGTGIVGFGVIDANGQKKTLVDAGVIRTRPHQPLDDRLIEIHEEISSIIKETKPEVMVIEKLFFARNVTTAISVSHARGVLMLAGKQAKLPIIELTPLEIKQSLTGYGKATKNQVQQMVQTMLQLSELPKPDDCADALAAALCYEPSMALSK